MALSHKYRTFDQLINDVTIDFSAYALEGMIEPQQLIKVAIRVNYDLGLRINRTKDTVIEVEHNSYYLGPHRIRTNIMNMNTGELIQYNYVQANSQMLFLMTYCNWRNIMFNIPPQEVVDQSQTRSQTGT